MDTKLAKKDNHGFYGWSGDLTQSALAVHCPYPYNGSENLEEQT
jgi:hypothetical protein